MYAFPKHVSPDDRFCTGVVISAAIFDVMVAAKFHLFMRKQNSLSTISSATGCVDSALSTSLTNIVKNFPTANRTDDLNCALVN